MTSEFMHLCTTHEPFRFGPNTICKHCGSRLGPDGASTEKHGQCTAKGHSRSYLVTLSGVRSWQCGCGRTWDERTVG